jgi:chromosome partitioning protein
MIVVAVVNTKGGVGKTTLTTALAVRAAKDGARVALIDLDPQRSLLEWWKRRQKPANPFVVEGVDTASEGLETLAGTAVDWVFVDTPPAFLSVLEDAVAAATFVLIPVKASVIDLLATQDAVVLCQKAGMPFAVVVNDVGQHDMKFVESARKTLDNARVPLTAAVVGHRGSHIAAATVGKTAAEINNGKDAKAVEEIEALWSEVKAGATKAAKAAKKREAAHG